MLGLRCIFDQTCKLIRERRCDYVSWCRRPLENTRTPIQSDTNTTRWHFIVISIKRPSLQFNEILLDQISCRTSKYFHTRYYPMKYKIRFHNYQIFFKTKVLNQSRKTRHRNASSWRSKTCHGWAKSLLTKLLIRWLPKLVYLLSGILQKCV